MRRHTVSDVMTTPVICAQLRTSFRDIATVIVRHGITAMPVVDSDQRVLGVVSEADLLAKEQHKDDGAAPPLMSRHARISREKAHALTARELMTAPAITVPPETTIAEAARLLDLHRIKWLPVVDDQEHLIGVVSRRDLLRVFTRPDGELQEEIVQDVFDHLLLEDPRAVSVVVDRGVATLTGQLQTKSLIPIVVRLTGATDGVVGVVDRLTYAEDDTQRAARRVPRA
jgi:CBS-domain-containing membrane protein